MPTYGDVVQNVFGAATKDLELEVGTFTININSKGHIIGVCGLLEEVTPTTVKPMPGEFRLGANNGVPEPCKFLLQGASASITSGAVVLDPMYKPVDIKVTPGSTVKAYATLHLTGAVAPEVAVAIIYE